MIPLDDLAVTADASQLYLVRMSTGEHIQPQVPHALEETAQTPPLSVLLCNALFRAAGQEWFECGDIWHRVARLRPIPAETLTGALFGTDGPLTSSPRGPPRSTMPDKHSEQRPTKEHCSGEHATSSPTT